MPGLRAQENRFRQMVRSKKDRGKRSFGGIGACAELIPPNPECPGVSDD